MTEVAKRTIQGCCAVFALHVLELHIKTGQFKNDDHKLGQASQASGRYTGHLCTQTASCKMR